MYARAEWEIETTRRVRQALWLANRIWSQSDPLPKVRAVWTHSRNRTLHLNHIKIPDVLTPYAFAITTDPYVSVTSVNMGFFDIK